MSDTQTPKHIVTVKVAAEIFAAAGQTEPAIRANIFKAADRFNSRGEVIRGNGLDEYGAIVHRGRRILIIVPNYAAWLLSNSTGPKP